MPAAPPGHLANLRLDEAPLAFVDVETTGLHAWLGDRICEVAVVKVRAGVEVGRLSTLVNPLRAISPSAYRVNGITAGMVATAPTFSQIARSVRAALEDCVLVAHNAPFDVGFLSRELGLVGEALPDGPVLDTLALARRAFRFRSNSLGALAIELGIVSPGHRALADALATREVFDRLVAHLFPRGARVADVLRRQGGAGPRPVASLAPGLPTDLAEAVRQGRRLRLRYVAGSGEETERGVDPIGLTGAGGGLSLVAFCRLRQEQRTFRLDRIVHWEVDEQAPPEPDGI